MSRRILERTCVEIFLVKQYYSIYICNFIAYHFCSLNIILTNILLFPETSFFFISLLPACWLSHCKAGITLLLSQCIK